MITPTEIKEKAEKKFAAFLQSVATGESILPIVITGNKKPDDDTVKFEAELTSLVNNSKEKKGYGYSIEYQKIKTKKHGLQDIPVSISFQTETDFLKFTKKETETANFRTDIAKILSVFPELKDWIVKYPLKVLENDWDSILKVCNYFKATPKPQLYIRELPINVHTKFIENNKGILKELLDIIIAGNQNADSKDFEQHFNLKYKEPLVRFRILDEEISRRYFSGVNELSVPESQFNSLDLPVTNIYIVENEINMLTFPTIKNCIVIWGHGFGAEILKEIQWLKNLQIFYWGDLDAQGFEILSQVRTYFPQTKSFLMDRATFDKFFENDKGKISKVSTELKLTTEENKLYNYLKENNLRLEQEKIPHEYAVARIPK